MWYLKRLIWPYVAPACLIFFFFLGACALASDERSLSFYQTHTGERLTVTYKVGDDYVPAAMEKINYILRDHRTGEVHPMDPKLLDFLYDVLTAVNNHGAVHIISGYRSPKTNQMLRGRNEERRRRLLPGQRFRSDRYRACKVLVVLICSPNKEKGQFVQNVSMYSRLNLTKNLKVRNIVYRAFKSGKIKRVGRGLYAGA